MCPEKILRTKKSKAIIPDAKIRVLLKSEILCICAIPLSTVLVLRGWPLLLSEKKIFSRAVGNGQNPNLLPRKILTIRMPVFSPRRLGVNILSFTVSERIFVAIFSIHWISKWRRSENVSEFSDTFSDRLHFEIQ